MGCKIRITPQGYIAYRLYWMGRESQEGTGDKANTRNLELHGRMAKKIGSMVKTGLFTVDHYRHYFPHGARRDLLGLPAWHRKAEKVPGDPTVSDFTARWLDAVKPPLISANLHRDRRSIVRAWIDPYVGKVKLQKVDLLTLQRWQSAMLGKGLALNSVKHAITSTFKAMWKHARITMQDQVRLGNPFDGLTWPKAISDAPDPFPEDEEKKILEAFRTKRPVYYPLALALFRTGMRPSEATALCWRHFDPGGGKVDIHQSRVMGEVGATKTPASRRTIALAADLADVIRELRPLHPDPDAPIFLNPRGNPVETAAFSKWIWITTLRSLDLKQRRLYATRHTYISQALTEGANPKYVAEYVGTSMQMIEKHYGRYMGSRGADPLSAARAQRNSDDVQSASRRTKKR